MPKKKRKKIAQVLLKVYGITVVAKVEEEKTTMIIELMKRLAIIHLGTMEEKSLEEEEIILEQMRGCITSLKLSVQLS